VHLFHHLSHKRRILEIIGKVKGNSCWRTGDARKVVYFAAACMGLSQRTTIFPLFPPLEKQWDGDNNEMATVVGT
jgi:hypothetical protein